MSDSRRIKKKIDKAQPLHEHEDESGKNKHTETTKIRTRTTTFLMGKKPYI